MSAAARLEDVDARFRGQAALTDVTASFAEGAVTGLLGRNGAGKTTLLRLLAGHLRPTSGRVEVLGGAPYENETVMAGTCFVRENQRYPDQFRVGDAVRAAASLYPNWDADLAASLLADFDLPVRRPIKKLSRGMTSAVGIVIGLAARAPLTLFDEPYLGLDAVARQLFYDRLLSDYAEHPRTVVLSTHHIEEAAGLLERIVLIDRGRIVLDADVDDLRGVAVSVSGAQADVDRFAAGQDVLERHAIAGRAQAVVRTTDADAGTRAAALGLAVEPVPLQRLVVSLSRSLPDLEEVPR